MNTVSSIPIKKSKGRSSCSLRLVLFRSARSRGYISSVRKQDTKWLGEISLRQGSPSLQRSVA